MHRGLIVALVCVSGSTARAQPAPSDAGKRSTYAMFSLPLLLGHTSQGDGGFLIGARPELVIARLAVVDDDEDHKAGPGIGVYGELLRSNGDTEIGGGLSYVRYRAGGATVTPSIGLYHRYIDKEISDNGVTASLFLGWRRQIGGLTPFDFPMGLRVEGRFGVDGSQERAIVIAADFDLMFPIVLIGSLLAARQSGGVFPVPK